MAREPFDESDESEGESPGMVQTQIEPRSTTAESELLELVAELRGVDATDLPSLYREVDHAVENLFKTPPSSDAQMEIGFSYAGCRVRIDQRGNVKVVPVDGWSPS
ncbi:HalOD1 output domain-containing protein [Halosimplex halobium]|uniref:HalOD1 output domain-containing protein n=1 Tax=Halosimplex halobium TaxID=3396618 RepID=UPI003F573FC5